MDIEAQIKLADEFAAQLAEKDGRIAALSSAVTKLASDNAVLRGMLRDRVPDDVEAE